MGQCASLLLQLSQPVAAANSIGDESTKVQLIQTLLYGSFGLAGFLAGASCAVALHEVTHVIAAWVLALVPDGRRAATTTLGILQWAVTNAPYLPAYLIAGGCKTLSAVPCIELPLPEELHPSHWRIAATRHSGWIASALLAALTCCLAAAAAPVTLPLTTSVLGAAVLYGVAAASVVVLLGALASDLLELQPSLPSPPTTHSLAVACDVYSQRCGQIHSRNSWRRSGIRATVCFFCGNIGLLVAAAAGSAVDMMSVLRSQIAISSQRGAQSGGLVALVESAPGDAAGGADGGNRGGKGSKRAVIDGIRSRCAPGKRDHLSVELHRRFGRALGRAPRLAGGHGIFVGHTRFATSSQPSEGESHPHQWSPPFTTSVWRTHPSSGRLEVAEEKFGVWITHNGDFDFWRLMGQDRTHSEVASFLNAALGCPSPAKCDSVRVAGMIELLRTQGLWFASLRLAYYDTAVECSFADVVASADPSYASKRGAGDGALSGDTEGCRSRRVATRGELQALAAALEAAFALLVLNIEPDDPATLVLPKVLDEDVAAVGQGTATAHVGNGSLYGGNGMVNNSVHGVVDGVIADVGKEGSVHGNHYANGLSRGQHGFGVSAGIGGGRPSVVPNEDVGPPAGAMDSFGVDDDDGDGTAAFLRERRPSFDGLMTGGERSLAGAVLAATMRAAVQRAAHDHHGQSVYGSMYGSMHGSVHGSHYPGVVGTVANAAAADPASRFHGTSHPGQGSASQLPKVHSGSPANMPPDYHLRGGAWTSVEHHGALDVRRRPGMAVATHTGHSAMDSTLPLPPRLSTSNIHQVGGGRDRTSHMYDLKTRGGNAVPPGSAPPEPHGGAAAGGANGSAATPATGAAAGHGARLDIPVSYGQEAVNMACAMGWARNRGARAALVSALMTAARKHLESTPGWTAWRATVPSLDRLIRAALSYFVANDLYTASCRFLKHAKGSFGLAILCSLEPDRLCMGAWGQPMAMSFSQAHHAIMYGSETNCSMIPIATRPGVSPAGGDSELDFGGGWVDVAGVAAVSVPHPPPAPMRPSVGHDTRRVQVRHIEDRFTDTIAVHGSTVEIIRDSSRHSSIHAGVVPGNTIGTHSVHSTYSAYGIPIPGAGTGAGNNPAIMMMGTSPPNGNRFGGVSSAMMMGTSPPAQNRYLGNSLAMMGTSPPNGNRFGGVSSAMMMGTSPPNSRLAMQRPQRRNAGGMTMSSLKGQPLGESVEAEGGPTTYRTRHLVGGCRNDTVRTAAAHPTPQSDLVADAESRDVFRGYENGNYAPGNPDWGFGGQGVVAVTVAPEEEEVVIENGWGPAFATHRIDIDEGSGEMMQLVLTDPTDPASAVDNADGWCMFRVQPFVRMRVFQLRTGTEVDTREDFEAQERIVQLVNNPYVTFSPSMDLTPGRDYVADDLKDVPRVLSLVRDTWTDPNSLNRQTAEDLFIMIDKLVQFAMTGGASSSERPGVDVLITGVEMSLWIAEQWAGDLKLVFPQLSVKAVSANKIISVLGNARGRIPPTGSTFCRSSASFLADHHTLCIAVSQSGQTFPTIHASRILNQLLPGRVFALCGSVDTKMALALGQRVALHSPFTRRVMTSCAGGRCAEPPSVVCVALHQTLSELLAFLVVRMRMTSVCASGRPLGMILSKDDMVDLRSVRDQFIDVSAPQLTGHDAAGRPFKSQHHFRLVQQGRRWALHVIESPTAWVLSLIHILATVVSGWPVVFAVVHGICLATKATHVVDLTLSKLALVVDSVIYMFLPIIYAVLLRAIQRRPLWHRMGKRTIVVADVPYVHQIIETFVSKMYALSYGIASVEVHGANPVDHFVHRFTHRVVRGLLIALGRPDGRLYSQTKSESWVLLGLLQAKVITSWGHQPEVVSIGHNPYHPSVVDHHLQLPTNRPRLLIEALEHNTGAVDPNQLWASRRHMVTSKFPLHHKAHELLQEMEDAAADFTPYNPSTKSKNTANGAVTSSGAAGNTRAGGQGNGHRAIMATGAVSGGGGGGRGAPSGPSTGVVRQHAGAGERKPLPPRPPRPPLAPAPPPPPIALSGRLGASLPSKLVRSRTSRLIGGPCNAYSQLSGEALLNTPAPDLRPLLGPDSKHLVGGHLLYGIFKKAELRKMWEKIGVVRQLASVLSTKQISESVAREAVAAVGSTLEDVLHKQTVMEQLLESRYLSLERLLAFMVMFHAMARRTADWWPLTFDIARSQSGLRVATTAAPVTASELEQSLAETLAGDVVEAAARRGEAAKRDRVRQILTSHIRKRAATGGAFGPRVL
ncbi:hypothetical protein VaNZ11_008318 [Volvox africanus]|uniref:Glutamine amidotransferase type-2 domain-containing protein n=1 Tax=Volvox africanus TaxID=51714 RepID=A0ABQ5S4U4_9CHLO|nr:hypothetical protein VaNZ11_008318 [Volvox africanus]